MLARIHVTDGRPWEGEFDLNKISSATEWYSVDRVALEGPYQSIIFDHQKPVLVPGAGPLKGTQIQWPRLWCALDDGRVIVADKLGENPPALWNDNIQVRGYYDLDFETGDLVWQPIGANWDEREIKEVQLLSNISYRLYKKLPDAPRRIFLFGAGASYGSDSDHVRRKGLLPPLGLQLFPLLRDAPNLKLWKNLSPEVKDAFIHKPFEVAMELLDSSPDGSKFAMGRDIELAEFFSQYRPKPANLYRRLAFRVENAIARNLGWTGAFITLNYERLLEESLLSTQLFPCVKGSTYYDVDPIDLPQNKLIEVCYPHGACQFVMSHGNHFNANIREQITIKNITGLTGAHHILQHHNVVQAYKDDLLPMICRYQAHKRPSINNYFMREQKERAAELIYEAESITMVGVICASESDPHLWGPLAKCSATIHYVDPSRSSIEIFKQWANQCGKEENRDFEIINSDFHTAFNEILRLNDLKLLDQ